MQYRFVQSPFNVRTNAQQAAVMQNSLKEMSSIVPTAEHVPDDSLRFQIQSIAASTPCPCDDTMYYTSYRLLNKLPPS